MKKQKIVHIVHCIDTEGPMIETLDATFSRIDAIFGIKLTPTRANLELIQNKKLDLCGQEEAVASCFSPELLSYNENWNDIEEMLDVMLSEGYRNEVKDDFGGGWVYSWHCMDHAGYKDNPRHKDIGYGNIFNFYHKKLTLSSSQQDEINWHFHPLSFNRNPIQSASSYLNSFDILLQILCRRVIDNGWFPVVNRPGFHTERPDSHAFLEQWIPFDYANQISDQAGDQPDLIQGRFGDWARASKSWRGYHPHHDDYQAEGDCRRKIFRCLNLGSRSNPLKKQHIREAFEEAEREGSSILSFNNHDYRDMRADVNFVRKILNELRPEYPDININFSGAEEAAIALTNAINFPAPKLEIFLNDNVLTVKIVEGEIFGPQPFLAIKTIEGSYFHDNFDLRKPLQKWSYVFDNQTIPIEQVAVIGVGTAGRFGKSCVVTKNIDQSKF